MIGELLNEEAIILIIFEVFSSSSISIIFNNGVITYRRPLPRLHENSF